MRFISSLRRHPVRRLVIGVVAGSFLLPSAATVSRSDAFDLAAADSPCWEFKAAEREFAAKMNDARGSRPRLSLDPELSKSATVHTREMTDRNLLFHTTPAQMNKRVIGWTTIGENVGMGTAVDSLHKAFMGSPLHRQNIMDSDYRHVGVGVMERSGQMWVTVMFTGGADPDTRLDMPRC